MVYFGIIFFLFYFVFLKCHWIVLNWLYFGLEFDNGLVPNGRQSIPENNFYWNIEEAIS